MRVTLADVARRAGVSTATVDRVVNERPGVHPRTQLLVRQAAASMGLRLEAAANADMAPALRLRFVLPGGTNTFINLLADHAADLSGDRVLVEVLRPSGLGAETTAAMLRDIAPDTDGLALVALDAPLVREAAKAFANLGKPVVAIASPITGLGPGGYIGIDNRSAGRVAGQLAARLVRERTGAVALLTGSLSYRGHEEREMGFRAVLAADAPGLSIHGVAETQDDNDRCHRAVRDLLDRAPDLRAVYNVGGGNRGVAQALEEAERADIVFIGHDLTEHTRRYLLSGVMDVSIVQSPKDEARLAVDRLIGALATGGKRPKPGPDTTLPLQIVFRENLPD